MGSLYSQRLKPSSVLRRIVFSSVLFFYGFVICEPSFAAEDIGAILNQIKAEGVAGFETAATEPVEECSEAPETSLEDLDAFFDSYIRSHASNNPWDVAGYYVDGARFCYAKSPSGRTTRAEIAEAARKFISSFPRRSYFDISVDQTVPIGPDAVRINYSFNYRYSGVKEAAGSSNVWITVERRAGVWKITSFDETVTRRR